MEEKIKRRRILIADDEPAIRSLVSGILGESYSIIMAGNGEEALDIARLEKPDLILMDIMMPRMDGYLACFSIKTDPELKYIPVIMLSGLGYELNMKLGQKFGADGYLRKPFKQQELTQIADRFLS